MLPFIDYVFTDTLGFHGISVPEKGFWEPVILH